MKTESGNERDEILVRVPNTLLHEVEVEEARADNKSELVSESKSEQDMWENEAKEYLESVTGSPARLAVVDELGYSDIGSGNGNFVSGSDGKWIPLKSLEALAGKNAANHYADSRFACIALSQSKLLEHQAAKYVISL